MAVINTASSPPPREAKAGTFNLVASESCMQGLTAPATQLDSSEKAGPRKDMAFLTHPGRHFSSAISSTPMTDLQRTLTSWKDEEGPDTSGADNKFGLHILFRPSYHSVDLKKRV